MPAWTNGTGRPAEAVTDAVTAVLRGHRGRELRGQHHPPPSGGRTRSAATRPSRRAGTSWPRRATGGSVPAWTTRCSPSGTPCTPRRWPRRRPAPGRPEWRDAAVAIGEFLVDPPDAPRTAGGAELAGEGGARHLAYAGRLRLAGRLLHPAGRADRRGRSGPNGPSATADALLDLFHDDDGGGFFTTGHDAEALIVRTKDIFDGATPSANAVAALALARLGALTGAARYTDAAREVVDMFGDLLTRHPTAFAHTVLTASLLVDGVDRGGGHRATGPTWSTRSGADGGPGPCWPGASPPARPCGRAGTGTGPTCAATTPACCRPTTPTPWWPSCRSTPPCRGDRVSKDSSHTPRSGTARDVVRGHPAPGPDRGGRRHLADRAGPGLPRRGHHRGGPGLGDPGPGPGRPGPRTTGPTWPPSTWSRPNWPTSPSATTWPSPRR